MSRCGILSNSFLHLLRWPYSFCLFFFFDVVHYMIGLCCWTILVNLGWIPLGCGVWSFFVCCWIWFSDILLRIFASINEVKVLVAQLCPTLCYPMDCSPQFLCPGNSPGKNTGVGYHALLQGIFPTQGLNWGFLIYRQILYCLSHWGKPVCFLTVEF